MFIADMQTEIHGNETCYYLIASFSRFW